MHRQEPPAGLWLEELAQSRVEELFGPDRRLPWELVLQIFLELDIASLGRAGSVSKDWHHVADCDVVWGRVYRQRFFEEIPLLTLAPVGNTWKGACKRIAQLPVVGTTCSAEYTQGNYHPGRINEVVQGVSVVLSNNERLLFAPGHLAIIKPAVRIRPVNGEGPMPPTTFAEVLRGQRKANYLQKVKRDLALGMIALLDQVDPELCEADWDRAFATDGAADDRELFQVTKNQLLDRLIAAASDHENADPGQDHSDDLGVMLMDRYKQGNRVAIRQRKSELANTSVLVVGAYGTYYRGKIVNCADDGRCEVLLDSDKALVFSSNVYLAAPGLEELHADMMKAISAGDHDGLRDLEVFVPSGGAWALSSIQRVRRPCFLFEIVFDAGWTKWCTLDQLRDFSQDMVHARNAFWRTVGSMDVPPEDPSLLGKRMLIQNRRQNIGGRIIQSHGPGTISAGLTEGASKVVYTYEQGSDLAEGRYTVSRQYHVTLELSQQCHWIGAERLFHFTGPPRAIAVGDRVLSEWRPNNWYIGTITHATPGGWHVSYDDGDQQDDVPPTGLMHLEAARYLPTAEGSPPGDDAAASQ